MKFKDIELKEGLVIREGKELETHYLEILPVKYIQQIFIARTQRKELLNWVYALIAFGAVVSLLLMFTSGARDDLWALPVIFFLALLGCMRITQQL